MEHPDHLNHLPVWLENVVLFYGARKSGTTMTLNLMDGGHEMFVSPAEIKLKRFLSEHWDHPETNKEKYFSRSTIRGWTYEGFDMEVYKAYIDRAEQEPDLKRLIQKDIYYQAKCSAHAPKDIKQWAMKEVGGHPEKILSFFRSFFPDGKVVFVFRHPKNVTASVIKNRKRRNMAMSLFQYYKQTRDPMFVMAKQERLRTAPYIFSLNYEDLTNEQTRQGVLEQLCAFLELSWHEAFDYTSEFGVRSVSRTSSQNTASVFSSNAPWHKGLSMMERIAVCVFGQMTLAELLIKGRLSDYKAAMLRYR